MMRLTGLSGGFPTKQQQQQQQKQREKQQQLTTMKVSPERQLQEAEERCRSCDNPLSGQSLRQTMQDMTMHGVQESVAPERPSWNRVLWLLLTLCSLTACVYLGYQVLTDYNLYPHKTSVEELPHDRLAFPAVTICNINTFHISNISYAEPLKDISLTMVVGKIRSRNRTAAMQEVYNMSAQKILEDTDPGINATFRTCMYDNEDVDCWTLFDVSYWAMTRCYTLNVSRLRQASAATKLRLVIDIMQDGYVMREEMSAGVKFFVHDPDEVPNLEAMTSTASPGFSTHVALTYRKLTLLDYPYKSFGGRYCVKEADIHPDLVPATGRYRLLGCLKMKVFLEAQATCNCTPPFQPMTTFPPCSLDAMLDCVLPILDATLDNPYQASDRLQCPVPCDLLTYPPSVSFSRFPSRAAQLALKDMLDADDVRSNILNLVFYYSDLIVRQSTQTPEYTSHSMMGTMGGNMGFFLGASVLSVGEILELLVIVLWMVFSKLLCTAKNVRPEVAD